MIKRTLFLFSVVCSVVPLRGAAQNLTPPPLAAPSSPAPPVPPKESGTGRKRAPSVFLGVIAGPVSPAMSDQLNLPAGFGLLVTYVVPGSPAEAAGIKVHDVLKMLNDQILTSGEQLSALVRNTPDGQAVNFVLLRKGQETKLTATLRQRSPHDGDDATGHEERWWDREGPAAGYDDFHFDLDDVPGPEFSERLERSLERSRAKVDAATARAREQARQATELARERTARASGSRLDYGDAHILLRDASGRIEIRIARGQRVLTLRDTDGKQTFTGPIDTPEQRKAIPADLLPQVEALERDQVTTFPKGERDDSDD